MKKVLALLLSGALLLSAAACSASPGGESSAGADSSSTAGESAARRVRKDFIHGRPAASDHHLCTGLDS